MNIGSKFIAISRTHAEKGEEHIAPGCPCLCTGIHRDGGVDGIDSTEEKRTFHPRDYIFREVE